MVALILFAGRADIMGEFRAGPLLRLLAMLGATVVLALNFVLLAQVFGIPLPGLAST